jgi:hypothetical protein
MASTGRARPIRASVAPLKPPVTGLVGPFAGAPAKKLHFHHLLGASTGFAGGSSRSVVRTHLEITPQRPHCVAGPGPALRAAAPLVPSVVSCAASVAAFKRICASASLATAFAFSTSANFSRDRRFPFRPSFRHLAVICACLCGLAIRRTRAGSILIESLFDASLWLTAHEDHKIGVIRRLRTDSFIRNDQRRAGRY